MASHLLIDDEFTLDVIEIPDDDDEEEEEVEIVYEKHFTIETDPEWEAQFERNLRFSSDIHIKQEVIDVEDNYIGEGQFLDLEKIETEIDVIDLEDSIETEKKEEITGEGKVEPEIIKKDCLEEDNLREDSIKEEKIKDGNLEEIAVENNVVPEKIKKHPLKKENLEEDTVKEEKIKNGNRKEIATEDNVEPEKMKTDLLKEENLKEDAVKGEEIQNGYLDKEKIKKIALGGEKAIEDIKEDMKECKIKEEKRDYIKEDCEEKIKQMSKSEKLIGEESKGEEIIKKGTITKIVLKEYKDEAKDSREEKPKENELKEENEIEDIKRVEVTEDDKEANIEGCKKEEISDTKEKGRNIQEKSGKRKEKQVPGNSPNITVNKSNVHKIKQRPPPNQKQNLSPPKHTKETLDKRKNFGHVNKNKRKQPPQDRPTDPYGKRRKFNQNQHQFNPRKFHDKNRRHTSRGQFTRYEQPQYNQNTSTNWETYNAILGVLNQAFGQQMAQNSQVNERSLVPQFPRRGNRGGRKNSWFDRGQERPSVWANGCGNGANAPFFPCPQQSQVYANFLQVFTQLNNGGLMQNNQNTNDVKFQMSFMNMYRS